MTDATQDNGGTSLRVLCGIDLRSGTDLVRRVVALLSEARLDVTVAHVVDLGPRHDQERRWSALRGSPRADPARYDAMVAAAEAAGREALDEARVAAKLLRVTASAVLEHGMPEQALVRLVRERAMEVIALRAREWQDPARSLGPHSIGHSARYVLDHAPCDVVLVRWEPINALNADPTPRRTS
jgi:nucleotide-binding universal stress UspA family protein